MELRSKVTTSALDAEDVLDAHSNDINECVGSENSSTDGAAGVLKPLPLIFNKIYYYIKNK